MKVKEITCYLEEIAPLSYQESYDNCGLICGSFETEVQGILCTLDATEPVVAEALAKGCNLIIAHHPIVFKGLKQLNGKNYVERTVIKAIQEDIAIYAIHTNLDNVSNGVNAKICDRLQLQDTKILATKTGFLRKLTTFVPVENKEAVLQAISEAGAGQIGNYSRCSFQLKGQGTFQPSKKAKPYIGAANQLETVDEVRIEVILPEHLSEQVIGAMKKAHPYEEVAYYLYPLTNENQSLGAGMIGNLPQSMQANELLVYLKKQMNLSCIRHTHLLERKIKKVAVCGGTGSFLLRNAIAKGADVFVTADFKYHEFFDAEDKIIIADIGHYESEIFTKELLFGLLRNRFQAIKLSLCEVNTNPVQYF